MDEQGAAGGQCHQDRPEPATGYQLNRRFRERLAHVWQASHQQIYRELGRLQEQGWIAGEEIPQEQRPDARRYRVTAAGEEALVQWLRQPQPPPAPRDPFLVKLFAGDLLDDATLRSEIATLREHWQGRMRAYRRLEGAYFQEPERMPRHYRL
ncbi:PadR family transcriptional regulator [Arhodomonas sp. SL1]|uniref:PadR family transcriptional regulator n=1 Tax=Arhodomonas sp. SL1 TaxID=3425691 RepID=UPI003F883061